jgi:hypothetical protein
MGWKQDVKKAASSDGGVSRQEAKQIARQYNNVNYGDIKSYSQGRDTWIGKPTRESNNTPSDFNPAATNPLSASDYAGIFQTLQTGQENLANIQGQWSQNAAQIGANAQVSSAGIRADADKEVARAYSDAQKYAASLGLEGVKYGADKESEWRQAVANIEVKGKLDLQPIINAGLEKVAGIEAQASRDVAETTGKYSLESMKQRTSADKSIGKMQLAGSMYGLIGSVFG